MSRNSNLPPGVTEGMIPGNRPEDIEHEQLMEYIEEKITFMSLSLDDVKTIFELGLEVFNKVHAMDGVFKHEQRY